MKRIQIVCLQALVFCVIILLLRAELLVWHSPWIGWPLLLLFLLLVAHWWREIFSAWYRMPWKSLVSLGIAWLTVIFLLSAGMSLVVAWHRITPGSLLFVFAVVGCLSFFLREISSRTVCAPDRPHAQEVSHITTPFPNLSSFFFVLIALAGCGIFLLFQSQTEETIFSPWQTIHPAFLFVAFCLLLFSGLLLFSRTPISIVLSGIILVSFVLHAALPMSHTEPWGADIWRHLASEYRLAKGESIPPVLFGPDAHWREVLGIDLPEALLVPHKYSYGPLWGLSLLIHKTTDADLVLIARWLVPILWSFFLPILLFRLGGTLFGSRRLSLFFAWGSLLFFPLQALGGLTLPNSLGFLFFLLALWMLFISLEWQDSRQKGMAIAFGLLLLPGYALYTLVFWVIFFAGHAFQFFEKMERPLVKQIASAVVFFVGFFALPLFELAAGTSRLPEAWAIIPALKQAAGQFSLWFFTTMIRPHDIMSGNILVNQTPEMSFVSTLFSDFRWHVLVLATLFWLVGVFWAMRMAIRENRIIVRLVGILFLWLLGWYLTAWYVLEGERLFVRRLDAILSLSLLLVLLFACARFRLPRALFFQRFLLSCFLIFLSWFGTTALVSGPDLRVMSESEHRAAQMIWDASDPAATPCVVGDTYLLLALEAVSSGAIVGGNFPIESSFGQKDRVALYEELRTHPTDETVQGALRLSQRPHCWLALPLIDVDILREEEMTRIIGKPPEQIGNLVLWYTGG